MNWNTSCSGGPDAKSRFHRAARVRLRQLALALRFAPASYELRSNLAGSPARARSPSTTMRSTSR